MDSVSTYVYSPPDSSNINHLRRRDRHNSGFKMATVRSKWTKKEVRSVIRFLRAKKVPPVEFQVFTAVVMKSTIFWDTTSCSPLNVNRSFGGSYRLHLQGRIMSRARYQREIRWQAEGNPHTRLQMKEAIAKFIRKITPIELSRVFANTMIRCVDGYLQARGDHFQHLM
jgi:hypothetical protein